MTEKKDPNGERSTTEGDFSRSISQTIPKRDSARGLRSYSFEELKYELVEVWSHGFRYRGKLMGASETDLYLRGLTKWWVVPLDRISDIRPIERL